MKLNYLEWKCPICGKKNRDETNTFAYGSPIRNCRYCNCEYVDRRWTEIAVEGPQDISTNPGNSLKLTVLLLVLTAFCWGFGYLRYIDGLNPFKFIVLGVLALIIAIFYIINAIRVRNGSNRDELRQYMRESEQRLQDPVYVQKLIYYGYKVPEKYIR